MTKSGLVVMQKIKIWKGGPGIVGGPKRKIRRKKRLQLKEKGSGGVPIVVGEKDISVFSIPSKERCRKSRG